MTVEFIVDGKPQGKERPRFSNGHTYTPAKTLNYERHVMVRYMESVGAKCFGERPVVAEITAVFKIPKSARKKDIPLMLDGTIKCKKKPDVDNIAKSILDSLNGLAYKDDSQIHRCEVRKMYGTEDKVIVRLSDENGE